MILRYMIHYFIHECEKQSVIRIVSRKYLDRFRVRFKSIHNDSLQKFRLY
jgi:hypothetical protein